MKFPEEYESELSQRLKTWPLRLLAVGAVGGFFAEVVGNKKLLAVFLVVLFIPGLLLAIWHLAVILTKMLSGHD